MILKPDTSRMIMDPFTSHQLHLLQATLLTLLQHVELELPPFHILEQIKTDEAASKIR